ncbi:MAG: site-specific integrase [Thiobacillus sp.]
MALDLEKLSAGSPLLLGEGLIPIDEAARAIGLTSGSLLGEMLNDRTTIYVQAQGWQGCQVPDLTAIERDYNESGFILNDVEAQGDKQTLSGTARIYDSSATIAKLIADGKTLESTFRLSGDAGFFCDDEQTITVAACFAQKNAAERIRMSLAGSTRPVAPLALIAPMVPVAPSPASESAPLDPITAKHGKKRFSELFDLYKADRSWGAVQAKRMETETGLFKELMSDPELGCIDKAMILRFAELLAKLPPDTYLYKRRFKTNSLHELIAIAEKNGLPLKPETTIKGHIGRLSEVLGYGEANRMLTFNPAADFKRGSRREMHRAQDERHVFSPEELDLIFSQDWFKNGAGNFTESRNWTFWRPLYYWLPLLGLLTGGRLNELSQLYLADIKQSEADKDVWYIDFNMVQSGKVADKSLKTVNAIRIVPIHDVLIRLGLLKYVAALQRAGHDRLFPELRWDGMKGYSKAAGAWFNERFLGGQLKIERDGKRTFHSLRHSFITALERLDTPSRVVDQLVGHERGKTQSMSRYAKDRNAVELQALINSVIFPCLSRVVPFDAQAGLKALKCSDHHKNGVARRLHRPPS